MSIKHTDKCPLKAISSHDCFMVCENNIYKWISVHAIVVCAMAWNAFSIWSADNRSTQTMSWQFASENCLEIKLFAKCRFKFVSVLDDSPCSAMYGSVYRKCDTPSTCASIDFNGFYLSYLHATVAPWHGAASCAALKQRKLRLPDVTVCHPNQKNAIDKQWKQSICANNDATWCKRQTFVSFGCLCLAVCVRVCTFVEQMAYPRRINQSVTNFFGSSSTNT